MGATPFEHSDVISPDAFARFYRQHLPAVYGYLLHLCAGDRSRAEDLTQDTWLALVDQLRGGRGECADVRWLVTVARSKFIDQARRDRRLKSKLAVLANDPPEDDAPPSGGEIVAQLANLQPMHRLVLVMRYVDDLPVPAIGAEIGRDVTATHSLLARARAELRRSERQVDHV